MYLSFNCFLNIFYKSFICYVLIFFFCSVLLEFRNPRTYVFLCFQSFTLKFIEIQLKCYKKNINNKGKNVRYYNDDRLFTKKKKKTITYIILRPRYYGHKVLFFF